MKQTFPLDGLVHTTPVAQGQTVLTAMRSVDVVAPEVAGHITFALSYSNDLDIELKPFGHDELTYRITSQGNDIVVRTARRVGVEGDEAYQKNFAHSNEFRFKQSDELRFELVRDVTSCEILFDSGLASTTELLFTEQVGALQLHNHGSDIVITTSEQRVKG
jgi:hypothetical protein